VHGHNFSLPEYHSDLHKRILLLLVVFLICLILSLFLSFCIINLLFRSLNFLATDANSWWRSNSIVVRPPVVAGELFPILR